MVLQKRAEFITGMYGCLALLSLCTQNWKEGSGPAFSLLLPARDALKVRVKFYKFFVSVCEYALSRVAVNCYSWMYVIHSRVCKIMIIIII